MIAENLSFEEIHEILQRYGIQVGAQRDISLLASSAVAQAYTHYLEKLFGFSYNVFCALYVSGKYWTLINNQFVGEKTEEIVTQHKDHFAELFVPSLQLYESVYAQFMQLKEETLRDPFEVLSILCDLYPPAIGALSIYNCFFRLKDEQVHRMLSEEQLKKVGEERNKIALLYPQFEALMKACAQRIGTQQGFEGILLSYLTLPEMQVYVKNRILSQYQLQELRQRSEGYLHIYLPESRKEYVISDTQIIQRVNKQFFGAVEAQTIIKGTSAYAGKVQGEAYNITTTPEHEMREGTILVAVHTHPDLIHLVKRSSALVVDEGGLLSHAAIVARELKKPCIIGTKIGTKIFKTGERLEVDAAKGVIRKL